MKKIGLLLLCLMLIVSLQSCVIQSSDEGLSAAELKAAGNATLVQHQSVKNLYNHANFVGSTKEENSNANL